MNHFNNQTSRKPTTKKTDRTFFFSSLNGFLLNQLKNMNTLLKETFQQPNTFHSFQKQFDNCVFLKQL